MIEAKNGVFNLATPNTSYIFKVGECGVLEHLYYGKRLDAFDAELMSNVQNVKICDATAYDKDHSLLFLDNLMTEFSTEGRGDYRLTSMKASYDNGHSVLDFVYETYSITHGIPSMEGLPSVYGDEFSTLEVVLKERLLPLRLRLYYLVSDEKDAIVRFSRVENEGSEDVYIQALASLQLDVPNPDWNLVTLDGAWARERMVCDRPLRPGIHINDSKTGASGAFHNPAIALKAPNATEFQGDVIGLNLIYSGNHQESVELSPYGRGRVLTGINPNTFTWRLKAKSSFTAPQAVMVYSDKGLNGMSHEMHRFVNENVCRGPWRDKERPVLVNNWEATYFDFNEEKLLDLADTAKDVGIELFVLDDGWFGERENDTTSLGDWTANGRKLPNGLAGLSSKLHEKGLMFGIWIEPEMVSEKSRLFERHPDWRIAIPNRKPGVGRNQYILDWTREDVTDYMIACISTLLEESKANYVKWDMNRFFSDFNTQGSDKYFMGEFLHRYVLGFYKVLEALTAKFPDILFEGCASGGNRFDLGVLCYMNQIWTSDDTDVLMRQFIQWGTSFFYPQSVMGCHVSASPNHQSLRISSIEDRFNVAAFGILGYEMDLTRLPSNELDVIKEQIRFYKKNRRLFQFGTFTRDISYFNGGNNLKWLVADEEHLVMLDACMLNVPNMPNDRLVIPLLDAGFNARGTERLLVSSRAQRIDRSRLGDNASKFKEDQRGLGLKTSVYAGQLESAGIVLGQRFTGSGDIRLTRIRPDFSTEMYIVDRMMI